MKSLAVISETDFSQFGGAVEKESRECRRCGRSRVRGGPVKYQYEDRQSKAAAMESTRGGCAKKIKQGTNSSTRSLRVVLSRTYILSSQTDARSRQRHHFRTNTCTCIE